MLLDFTKYSVEEIISSLSNQDLNDWATEIFNFLKEWNHDSTTVKVKTSGSTGKSKLIELQKTAMINSAKATIEFLNLKENNSALLCLPAKYIAGKMMIVRALVGKFRLYCNEPKLEIHVSESIDFCAMTPTQAENSLDSLNHIKTLILGGAPVSFGLQTKLQSFKTKVFETYGMTETITHIALKQLILRQAQDDARQAQDNSNYFLCLPNVTVSKDNRNCLVIDVPKISNQKIITNDIVNLINNQTFEWLGRVDFIINSGGVKINPEVVEKKLQNQIKEPFIISSLPDEQFGEKVVLIIEKKEKRGKKKEESLMLRQAQHDSLRNIKFKNLSKIEQPKEIFFLDEFIRTENGKIQRKLTTQSLIT